MKRLSLLGCFRVITCLWIMLRLVAGCRRGERNWGSHRRTRRNGPALLWSTCPKLKTDGASDAGPAGQALLCSGIRPCPSLHRRPDDLSRLRSGAGAAAFQRLCAACQACCSASAGAAGNLNVSRSGKSMHHVCPAKSGAPGGIFRRGAALVFSKSVPDTLHSLRGGGKGPASAHWRRPV